MSHKLSLHIFDVGQGANALLDFGGNRFGIVDCGGTSATAQAGIASFLRHACTSNPSTRILFLIVTHLDMDHVRTVVDLFEDKDIGNRIERLYCNDLAYRGLLNAVKIAANRPRSGIGSSRSSLSTLRALRYLSDLILERSHSDLNFHLECIAPEPSESDRYPVRLSQPGLGREFDINIWAPSQRLRDAVLERISLPPNELLGAVLAGHEIEDWNSASIVLTVSFGNRQVLLAGDATCRTWQEIFQRAEDRWTGADVVVAWHHGGKLGAHHGVDYDSMVWQRVLNRSGKIVCVSAGHGNRYGHPHPETLGVIRNLSGQVYCTQRKGSSISNESDVGNGYKESKTVTLLRQLSKSGLTIENNGNKCCGHIVIEVEPTSELKITCSSGGCVDRLAHLSCCSAS